METKILKNYHEIRPYINNARECADLHRSALGFLTPSVYEEQALQGKLWICVGLEKKDYLGHLMFGGKYPYLKIFQLVVHPEHRKEMIPFCLVAELEKFGTENSYLNITARVAADLEANIFWDFVGLKLVRQVKGGRARGRTINLRSKDLETTSLLSLIDFKNKHDCTLVTYKNNSLCASDLYILDINVLLDILRDRSGKKKASTIVRAGLNNHVRIAVTEEFITELKRANLDRTSDPLLDFACELPIVRVNDKIEVINLADELRSLVFPNRGKNRKKADQDQSDLIHLATCIVAKADGFITREKSILRAKNTLFLQYNLDVISPFELEEPESIQISDIQVRDIIKQDNDLRIRSLRAGDLPAIEKYLSELNLKESEKNAILSEGTTGSLRQRIILSHKSTVIGLASWDIPASVTKETSAYLLISEDNQVAEKAIDHILESIIRSNNSDNKKLKLYFCCDQIKTKSTAIIRGFRSEKFSKDTILTLMVKVCFSGFIISDNWERFTRKFKALTSLSLPKAMPRFRDVDDKCLYIKDDGEDKEVLLSLFELETLISPCIVLQGERNGILLPIKPEYAIELGLYEPSQRSFLPAKEAFLNIEKAYFRKNKNIRIYKRGMIAFFYVSRKGEYSQSVIGCGRIVYSDACHEDSVSKKFSRQGVLPKADLASIADKNKLIHVVIFDNICMFKHKVSLNFLKRNKHVSKMNLVTGEVQSPSQTLSILGCAFSAERDI